MPKFFPTSFTSSRQQQQQRDKKQGNVPTTNTTTTRLCKRERERERKRSPLIGFSPQNVTSRPGEHKCLPRQHGNYTVRVCSPIPACCVCLPWWRNLRSSLLFSSLHSFRGENCGGNGYVWSLCPSVCMNCLLLLYIWEAQGEIIWLSHQQKQHQHHGQKE